MPVDTEEAKNTLFGEVKKFATYEVKELEALEVSKSGASEVRELGANQVDNSRTPKVPKLGSSDVPKWKTFEKATVLLSGEHRDAIDELSKKIMRYRSKHGKPSEARERITANSVFRAAISHFLERIGSLDMEAIENEEELYDWIKKIFH